jgi:hypothetical protein
MSHKYEPRVPDWGIDPAAAIAAPDDSTDPDALPAMEIQREAAEREYDHPADASEPSDSPAPEDMADEWRDADPDAGPSK